MYFHVNPQQKDMRAPDICNVENQGSQVEPAWCKLESGCQGLMWPLLARKRISSYTQANSLTQDSEKFKGIIITSLPFLTQTPSLSKTRYLRAGFLNLSLSDRFDKFLVHCKLFSNFPNLYLVGVNITQSLIHTGKFPERTRQNSTQLRTTALGELNVQGFYFFH